jgi:membrane-associated phospholipid phosphatase
MARLTLTRFTLWIVLAMVLAPQVWAQQQTTTAQVAAKDEDSGIPANVYPNKVGVDLFKNIAVDQRRIWTSPIRLRPHDAEWLIPFVGTTAGLIVFDADISRHLVSHQSLISTSNTAGTAGLAATFGAAGGMYLLGKLQKDEHRRETGYLAGLSLINGLAVTEVFKYSFGRQRPNEGNGNGDFFSGGVSFFSEHSMAAWSVASVIAHEYPGPMTKFLAYSAASAISVSRVTARQHFPSDVLVGSTLGYLIGRDVYRAHHDRGLPGASIGTFVRSSDKSEKTPTALRNLASPFVPIDSWTYPVFDRLMALGFVRSEMLGIKPWTRIECARLVKEFEDSSSGAEIGELQQLHAELKREFALELSALEGGGNRTAQLDSLYTRVLGISGDSLRDSYHFGTTIENDYGRPYASGVNAIVGLSASAASGPAAVYVRGEYQYAPSAPYYSQATFDQIQLADFKPLQPAPTNFAGANRLRLLDAYATYARGNYQFSFGKQSLWWGPTSSALLSSNNAEPITMFRITRTTPFELPRPLGFLGKVRMEFFVGRLSGQHFVNTEHGPIFDRVNATWVGNINEPLSNQPFIHGEKVTFKPTPNFEFAISRTGLFGGPDFPITVSRLWNVFFSTAGGYSGSNDPGDRRSALDFTWRLPGLRKWATLYMDAFTEDEISPIAYWHQSAITPGVYLPRLPGLKRFDFRAEGGYSNVPGVIQPDGIGFFYWNIRYVDGYTKDGMVLGSTLPRRGRSYRFSTTFWQSPRDTFKLEYIRQTLDPEFLRGGSNQRVALHSAFALSPSTGLSSTVQYEWYRFPLLAPSEKKVVTAAIQLTYQPKGRQK